MLSRSATRSETETVIVRLADQGARDLSAKAQRGRMQANIAVQSTFMARAAQLGAKEIGRVHHVLNAVFLQVDRKMLPELAADPMVERIAPVADYELDLAETVPYIGGTVLHASGFDGAGVRVAVLDSGIDYTHFNLFGSGDPAEFAANDPNVVEPGTFPTAKVVGGFDFVGGVWPNGDLAPDADPLDLGSHGTHVADIIAGRDGVAPGASLYALQVCSSVASSCSGVALIQAMDFAVDPNGDGDTSDHVDVINMSLGSNYGQPFDDDLVLAVENATQIGVLTVASAGNGGDRPYVTGTPAAAKSALSVAQTQVPSAQLSLMTVLAPEGSAGDYPAVHQSWSAEQLTVISGPVLYGDGAGGNLDGCAAFAPGSLTGQIVMVDRGACNFSLKIQNIEAGGGILGIIGLIAPGEPFVGAFGGGTPPAIPGYMIDQATANILRSGTAVVSFDPANVLPLSQSIVSSSSRGPRNGDNMIKPEIGAPGGSVSAITGTGTGVSAFSGTSGAAPMVTGSAALLIQALGPQLTLANGQGYETPLLVKSILMNYSEANVARDSTGVPAEVTRIGSGEVRVDASSEALVAAWSVEDGAAALSLGHVDAWKRHVVKRTVRVKNLTGHRLNFNVSSSFKFADDEATGAIEIHHPDRISVPRRGYRDFEVRFVIKSQFLGGNTMSSGGDGAAPATLTAAEFDGLITLDDGLTPLHLPWQVIPRRSAHVWASRYDLQVVDGKARVFLDNIGRGDAQNEAFELFGLSGNLPAGPVGGQSPMPDLRAVGVNTAAVPAGVCSDLDSFIWSFAVTTHERQTHVLPVIHSIVIDTDQDGVQDFEIANVDLGAGQGLDLDGRNAVFVFDLVNGAEPSIFFFTEHATNTANTVLRVCAEQIGLTAADLGTRQIDVTVSALDFYFGGPGDTIAPVTLVPGGERFSFEYDTTIPAQSLSVFLAHDVNPANTSALGAQLITNSDFGAGAHGGAAVDTEAVLFTLPGVAIP